MKRKGANRVKRKSMLLLLVTAVLLMLFSACIQAPTHTHSYKESWSNDATQHWHECASCSEKIDVKDHEFIWETKTQATCETPLVEEGVCACGYKTTRTDEKAGHTLTLHKSQAATCTQGGWSAYETCSKCSYSTKVEIAAKGHSYSSAWTKDETRHWHVCDRCGDTKDAAGHTYDSGVINGLKKIYTCSVCQNKKETKLADGVKESMYGTANSAVVLDGDRSYVVSAVKTQSGVFIYAEGVFNTSVSNAENWYENTNFEFTLNGGAQSYVTVKNQSDKVSDFTYTAERLSSGKYQHTAEVFVEKSLINGWSASANVQLNYAWKTPTENAAILSDMADYRYLSEWGNESDWHSYHTYGCLANSFNDLPANLWISSDGLIKETAPTGFATIDGTLTSSELSKLGAEELNVTGTVGSTVNVKGTVADGDLYLAFTITHGAWSNYTREWHVNDNIELYINGVHTVVLFINGEASIPCHVTQGAAKTVAQNGKQVTVVELYVKGEQNTYTVSANANGAGFGWNDIAWGVSGEKVATASSAGLALVVVHEHTPGTAWEHDATYHWNDCVANDDQVYNKAKHSFDNVCDTACVCGYTRTVTHVYSNACDGTCNTPGCGKTRTPANHVWEITSGNPLKTCSVCKATAEHGGSPVAWTINGVSVGRYTLVYHDSAHKQYLDALKTKIKTATGFTLAVKSDSASNSQYEILFGNTTKNESSLVSTPAALNYVLAVKNGKLVVKTGGEHSLIKLMSEFTDIVIGSSKTVQMGASYTFKGNFYDDPYDSSRASGTNVRFMSVNVQAELTNYNNIITEAGFAFERRVEIFFAGLDYYNPDVVGLQEFCMSWYAQLSNYQNVGQWEILKFKNPILTNENVLSTIMFRKDKFTLVDSGMTYYSVYANNRCRCISWAVLKDKTTGKEFCFVSTHWEGTADVEKGWQQVAELTNFVNEKAKKYPVFTTGDFNRNEWTDEIKALLSDTNSVDCKYAAKNRVNNIGSWHEWGCDTPSSGSGDHITATAPHANVLKFETLMYNEQIWASDHAWVMADIQFVDKKAVGVTYVNANVETTNAALPPQIVWDTTNKTTQYTHTAQSALPADKVWISGKMAKATVITQINYYVPSTDNIIRARGSYFEASVDGVKWTKIATLPDTNEAFVKGGVITLKVEDYTQYQYIRIVQDEKKYSWYWSIGTVEVIGYFK